MGKTSQLDSSVAARFLLGFEGNSLTGEMGALLEQGLAGVAIFPRNFSSLEGLRSFTAEIRRAAGQPVLVGMDAEPGGPFSLSEPFTQWPAAADLGALDDAALVEQLAQAIGTELRAVGVNLNFAPMLDLHVHPGSPVTSERSFGSRPHQVARLGRAFLGGLLKQGVLACAKHFPGHGDAQVDPHEELPVFQGAAARLDGMELVPFAAAVAAGVPAIMTAHILLPQIDPRWPATLSRKMLTEMLRERMGFRGVILADDLGMGAIRKRYGIGEAAIASIKAGSDIIMICHDASAVEPALQAVKGARAAGLFAESEWQASVERIRAVQGAAEEITKTSSASLDVVGCAAHRALAAEIRSRIARALGK